MREKAPICKLFVAMRCIIKHTRYMDLYKETLQLIKESPRSLADQAKVHGVSLRWIHSMKSGELDPGYFKLKAFNASLKREHNARIRQLLKGQNKSRPVGGGGK